MSGMPAAIQTISANHATYTVAVTGPGGVNIRKLGKGQIGIDVAGSTAASTVSIVQTSTSSQSNGSLLPVARIRATSGQIGQVFGLRTVNLVGTANFTGSVGSLQVAAVGRSAQIIASGGLGSLIVGGAINLGPQGKIAVAGDLAGNLQAGSINLDGGKIQVGHNLGNLAVGSLTVARGGLLSIGGGAGTIAVSGDTSVAAGSVNIGEDAGSLSFGHNLGIAPGGRIGIGRDVLSTATVGGGVSIDAGQLFVGRDLAGSLRVNGDLAIVDGGNLTVGRDVSGGLAVNGNLGLSLGGFVAVGRSFGGLGLTVGGNLTTGAGSTIRVGGNLAALAVGGTITGQDGGVDMTVGLDLNNFSVAGGAANAGGVENFNLDVGKNIVGLNVAHGLFNDFITAGVLITNVNVGADGPVAVFDTEIRAGVQITNAAFNGDVKSDRPINPLGRRTRIIAGEDRLGGFEIGGNMVNVTVSGSLIDAVLVASVQPTGGDGSVQVSPSTLPPTGPDYYDAPAGGVYRRVANLGLPYAAPPFDRTIDPAVHNRVLPGTINRNFFQPPKPDGTIVYPTTSTVLGGVITTVHANNSDYAGLFAADTSGVFAGTLPS